MPGVSGLELARTLARRHPEIHVALLTGYADEIAERAFDADGVELLLSKPTRAGDLVRLLDELTS
jgi:CheY-like chemotaxis protein